MKANTKVMNFFGESSIKQMDGLDQSTSVFGIDLGTTNSAISVILKGNTPTTIKLTDGRLTMPSCVMWQDGKFIVGHEAYEHREQANVCYSVKRWMQNPDKVVTFRQGSKTLEMRPAEVSAEILKGLVKQTGGVYGEIKDVVVTVPAYFDQNGRNATREACELAGLNLIDIINEPTSAALCKRLEDGEGNKDFIVFDFGGGTLDITLARILKNEVDDEMAELYGFDGNEEDSGTIIQCKAIEGNSHLGGDDIDLELLEIVGKKLEAAFGVSLSELPVEYKEGLLLRLEGFKKDDVRSVFDMNIDTSVVGKGRISGKVQVTPADFRASLEPVYKKCKKVMDKLLNKVENEAKIVILVGGSTKNPLLVEMLQADYPDFNFQPASDPDLVVTQGAAVKGKIDKFGDSDVQIFDILPLPIGIVEEDGKVKCVIDSGAVLPASKSVAFTNTVDNQEVMRLTVVQGESNFADECVSLGQLVFDGIPKVKEGEADLLVTISVNADSVMTCRGKINGKSKELKLALTGESNGKMDRNAKRLQRLKAKAEKLTGKDRERAMEMIAGFPSKCSIKDISDFLVNKFGGQISSEKDKGKQ